MPKVAANFIKKVAGASMEKAQKKIAKLKWGKNSLLTGTRYNAKKKEFSQWQSCAMGIAELAACSTPDSLLHMNYPSGLEKSRLGKVASKTVLSYRGLCPIPPKGKAKQCKFNFGEPGGGGQKAEEGISHVNDVHAKDWKDCQKLLLKLAEYELKATEAKKKKK